MHSPLWKEAVTLSRSDSYNEERVKVLNTQLEKINLTDEPMENCNGMYNKVVCIGVDGNPRSEYAIDFYADNIHKSGNFLVVVHVFEVPSMHAFQDIYVSPVTWDITMEQESKRVHQLKEYLRQKLSSRNIPGKFVSRNGKAGEVLVQVANEEGAEMILVGTRGHGKLRRAILGSVSDYVTHNANCSVLVCREPGRSRAGSESRSRSNSESIVTKKRESKRNRTCSETSQTKVNET